MELAKELKLSSRETEALRAAALLHDIGKLAVPEHIISKPGRLTPEEFEKMKIHPVVGAEILERVQFPYPVVPIVRAHHEKWDGTGYPYGLAGEKIPMGARIIAAVDCLDALASDRQYRRALPLDEAMKVVISDSGKAFDPRVVEVLKQGYIQWERLAQEKSGQAGKLSTEVKFERGAAPAAGFEATKQAEAPTGDKAAAGPTDFLTSIASARQEVQALFEISQDLGNSLSLDETLSVLAVRLRKIIPHHALAIWIQKDGVLYPEYVTGEDYRIFSSLEIPVGQGLSGWVAHTRKPIVNGNPTVESSYLTDANKNSVLRSAVAVPLEGMNGVVGVLSLYHMDRDAFTKRPFAHPAGESAPRSGCPSKTRCASVRWSRRLPPTFLPTFPMRALCSSPWTRRFRALSAAIRPWPCWWWIWMDLSRLTTALDILMEIRR